MDLEIKVSASAMETKDKSREEAFLKFPESDYEVKAGIPIEARSNN